MLGFNVEAVIRDVTEGFTKAIDLLKGIVERLDRTNKLLQEVIDLWKEKNG